MHGPKSEGLAIECRSFGPNAGGPANIVDSNCHTNFRDTTLARRGGVLRRVTSGALLTGDGDGITVEPRPREKLYTRADLE
jgi:hypothetical protein